MLVPREVRFSEFDQPTTSGGAWSGNSPLLGGYIVGIRIQPTTATNNYDINFVDKDSYTIFERIGLIGTFQLYMRNGPIPVRSILTATISNATVDEDIDLDLILEPS